MILAGIKALASLSPALKDPDAPLLPDFQDAPDCNYEVAVAVAEQAFDEGLADVEYTKEDVRRKLRDSLWRPVYGTYTYDPNGEV
jgi:malate dehydrogenase (oxaloacetate-decarboxylating)